MSIVSLETMHQAVELMLARTMDGRQKWTRFEASDDEYQSESPGFLYFVRSRDDDGNAPYVVEIARKIPSQERLVKVASFTTGTGASTVWDQRDLDELIEQLYERAKSSAWGLESTEKDLLDELSVD